MGRGIPFNKPHGIKIHEIGNDFITTVIPYKRINQNHIRGVHACGLATAAEFCSGLVMLRNLDPREYRLIMQKIEVEYFYQAKKTALATFQLSQSVFENEILSTLKKEGKVFHTCEVIVKDTDDNHLCTAHIRWQVKSWDQVKTKA